jgi:hypothetical protein
MDEFFVLRSILSGLVIEWIKSDGYTKSAAVRKKDQRREAQDLEAPARWDELCYRQAEIE